MHIFKVIFILKYKIVIKQKDDELLLQISVSEVYACALICNLYIMMPPYLSKMAENGVQTNSFCS
jgi:hypothetical protein